MVEPILSMVLQLREGLETLGVLNAARDYPKLFRCVFTPSEDDVFKVHAEEFIDGLDVLFSLEGSSKRDKEINTFKMFTDMVLDLEENGMLLFIPCSFHLLRHIFLSQSGTDF